MCHGIAGRAYAARTSCLRHSVGVALVIAAAPRVAPTASARR
jgi:hypothetical protein